jgi:hypothetical protein
MRDLIDMHGASGAVYRFNLIREGRPLSPMGGNYLYVRQSGDSYVVVLAGEAQNLLTDARAHWDRAVVEHGATDLFTRLNVSEKTRRHEHEDIMAAALPPMSERASSEEAS